MKPANRQQVPPCPSSYRDQRVQIAGYDRSGNPYRLAAHLVDSSQSGFGVEALAPLMVDSMVSLTGDLHSSDFCMRLKARARVAYCRRQEFGLFRIGLSFEDVSYRSLYCRHKSQRAHPSPSVKRAREVA